MVMVGPRQVGKTTLLQLISDSDLSYFNASFAVGI